MLGVPGNNKTGPFLPWILPLFRAAEPAELQKRKTEFIEKVKAMIQDAFGEHVEDMLEVQGLATAPEKQGREYATALMKIVTDMADAQGRETFVITADAYGFYETLGFKVVRQELLGVDNPKWQGAPVTLYIMLRKQFGLK
ncbi:hypothetical protein L227DRAFT_609997 [Lentinus tigrinus ALCF2SS1-6]|uniref:N-acetyltransferase domain-containing protein n=1 Tax=Lentinus tigrinus ALCF2SS1-6 TaxID=1328759 RepID=A0A5C2SEI3_9APHY|nr:hypothetical protein L227DRAFT_609997 [Lentinus tigrinus ALCF2SS1-6]